MIDLTTEYVRSYLQGITQRVATAGETLDWLNGTPTLNPAELEPGFDGDAPPESLQAFIRLANLTQSGGPRALNLRRSGAIGNVNWGGDNDNTDERLARLNLDALAARAYKNYFANGITAFWAYLPESGGDPRLQVLGGYLEPLYDDADPAGEIVALYQVLSNPDSMHASRQYRVRVYDLEERAVRQWDGLAQPYAIGRPPDRVFENQEPPNIVLSDTDQDGYALGEGRTILPFLKQELSVQLRIMRASQSHAFGMYAFTGEWQLPTYFGPTQVLMGGENASVDRLAPGELGPLFTEHDRIQERIRADARLPITSMTGGDFPSGEAITQANQAYISACRDDATALAAGLTAGVEAYARLAGVEPAPVSIEINREALRTQVLRDAREDYREGIISLRMAAVAASPYYPATTEEELEEFLDAHEPRTPDPSPGELNPEDDA